MSEHTAWGLPDPDRQPEFYANVPTKRLLAFVADTLIVGAICLLLIPFTAFIALFFLPLLWLVVNLAYRIVTLANSSATPGMRLVGIEFRTTTGARFDLGRAAAHSVLFAIWFAMFFPQVISIILMLTSARGQGLSDHILGTAAINRAAEH
ncbi:MAG: RDD family protein [Paracoccaceae bacterium]